MTILLLELDLGLGCIIERTEVEFKFSLEEFPISEPGKLQYWSAVPVRYSKRGCTGPWQNLS
jgi:hypothetical protein